MDDIFKTRFSKAKCNLEEKVKIMTVLAWVEIGNVRKKVLSQGKIRKWKDIFTQEKKKY